MERRILESRPFISHKQCGRHLMWRLAHKLVLIAAVFAVLAMQPVLAGTPDKVLVMAKNIDDIISLDPAQVFEFSGGELIANIYDRITMYEPEDLTKLVGGVAESWSFSEDGKTIR